MWCFALGAFLMFATPLQGQPAGAPDRTEGVKVFIDCAAPAKCDEDFLRQEITVVSYVRDRQDADVHVLVTSQPTGGRGLEYTVQFIGLRRFSEIERRQRIARADNLTPVGEGLAGKPGELFGHVDLAASLA